MSDRPECLVRDCYVPGQHVTDCADYTKCDGCAPGLAAPGLLVCLAHRQRVERDLDRLPLLYAQLGDRLASYRSPQAPKGEGGRSSEVPLPIDAEAFRVRQAMLERLSLIASYVLIEKRREDARAGHETTALQPKGDVPGMVAFLVRWADWTCAHRQACAPYWWGDRVSELVGDARHVVNRGRASGIYLGACPVTVADQGQSRPCGGPIRYVSTGDYDLTSGVACPWCGTEDTLGWWHKRIAGEVVDAPLQTAADLAPRITLKLGAAVSPSLLAKWRERREVDTIAWCQLAGDRRPRVLYDAVSVERRARKAFGLLDEQEAS